MKSSVLDVIKSYLKEGKVDKAVASLVMDKANIASFDKISSGNVCGRYKASLENKQLVYVKDVLTTVDSVETTEEVRNCLKELHQKCSYLLNSQEVKEDKYKLDIYKTMVDVREWCLGNGFYGKALDFAKLINSKFKACQADTLERAVRGYAKRQLERGINCLGKAQIAIRDAQLGKYGTLAKLRGRQYYMDVFNSAKISLPYKKSFGRVGFVEIGMEDYKKVSSMESVITK